MPSQTQEPTLAEKETLVAQAGRCLDCDAPECFEFTPEGVDVCAGLPFWNGKPVSKSMLIAWHHSLAARAERPEQN